MFKKSAMLMVAALLSGAIVPAVATASDTLSIRLNGLFVGEFGMRRQNRLPNFDTNKSSWYMTTSQKNSAFFTGADVRVSIGGDNGSGLKYGAVIAVTPTSNMLNRYSLTGSYIHAEDLFGRIEVGSRASAADLMTVSAYDYATGSSSNGVGSWNSYYVSNPYSTTTGPNATALSADTTAGAGMVKYQYVDGTTGDYYTVKGVGDPVTTLGFYGDKFTAAGEKTRRITYYTPKISGIQLGASYAADSGNNGSQGTYNAGQGYYSRLTLQSIDFGADGTAPVAFLSKFSIKNLISAAVSYEHEFGHDVLFKGSVTAETGNVKASNSIYGTVADYSTTANKTTALTACNKNKFQNIRSYNVGASIQRGNVTVSASYADLGKAFLSSTIDLLVNNVSYMYGNNTLKTTKVITMGATYKNGPLSVGVLYFGSSALGSKLSSVTLGTDYTLASGFKVYADATAIRGTSLIRRFTYNTYYIPVADGGPVSVRRHGMVYTIGAKVAF